MIRGEDHVSNTPKQIRILEALGRELPVYAHVPNVFGTDGKKLSKRHGAVSVEEFRDEGYLAPALMNYLALLGWSYDDRTTMMSRDELVERFTLDRVGSSPATFDYAKLDWMNGVYLRELPPDEYADALVAYLREHGLRGRRGDDPRLGAARPGEDLAPGRVPGVRRLLLPPGRAARRSSSTAPARCSPRRARRSPASSRSPPSRSRRALRGLAERLGLKPRDAFGPIRAAVTGSKVSPGLFESLELLGREESLARLAGPLAVEDEAAREEGEAGGPDGPGGEHGAGREEEGAADDEDGGDDRRRPTAARGAVRVRRGLGAPVGADGEAPCARGRAGARGARGRARRATPGRSGSTSSTSPASSA